MLTASRSERIARQQGLVRARHTDDLRDRFAAQVPHEYRVVPLAEVLREGQKLSRGDEGAAAVLGMRQYMKSPSRFLIMSGPTGTGKSTAAYAIADALVAVRSEAARFISANALLSQLSFGHADKSATEILDEYSSAPILVLDDIGSANDGMSAHQERSLWALIEARWSNRLTTIITTNMGITGGRDGRGLSDIFGVSAMDRIRDSLSLITFDGESLRGRKR